MRARCTGGADSEKSFQISSPDVGLEPERAVLELELEVLAEHVLDVVLATPFVGLAALDRLLGEAPVELARASGSASRR